MTVLYNKLSVPTKITDFSFKVRIMIDNNYSSRKTVRRTSNIIQFPGTSHKIGKHASNLYLEACQQLLRPVREFFFETEDDDGEGGKGGFTVYDLDGYLGDLKEIQGYYLENSAAEQQLAQQERQKLQADVANLQAAGFEYTAENEPAILASYGEQLTERHLPANYAEFGDNSAVSSELKKAYADVAAMIRQAQQQSTEVTSTPRLTR